MHTLPRYLTTSCTHLTHLGALGSSSLSPLFLYLYHPPSLTSNQEFHVVGFLPLILACLHFSEWWYLFFFFPLGQVGEWVFGFLALHLESFRSSCIISCFPDLEYTLLYIYLWTLFSTLVG